MRRGLFLLPALLVFSILASCSRQAPLAPSAGASRAAAPAPDADAATFARLQHIASAADGGTGELARGLHLVVVPAGSNDALAAAIDQVSAGGIVVVKAGRHTEHASVVVTKRVTIAGEPGAIVLSAAGQPSNAAPNPLKPAIEVRASGSTVWGLDLRPLAGDGSAAITVNGASDVLLFKNRTSGFQYSINVFHGDRARIWGNHVEATAQFFGGAVSEADNIILVSGEYGSVMNNESLHGTFGVWVCDEYGLVSGNNSHDNFVGLLMCRVPQGSFLLSDGSLQGADQTASQWLATGNLTTANVATGLLVIDGANHNIVSSNHSSNNGSYAVEFAGDSNRFGFFTPTCHDNTFIAGTDPAIQVKDCGQHNRIIGGTLVNNALEPCN